jgi:hypothetical protein
MQRYKNDTSKNDEKPFLTNYNHFLPVLSFSNRMLRPIQTLKHKSTPKWSFQKKRGYKPKIARQ